MPAAGVPAYPVHLSSRHTPQVHTDRVGAASREGVPFHGESPRPETGDVQPVIGGSRDRAPGHGEGGLPALVYVDTAVSPRHGAVQELRAPVCPHGVLPRCEEGAPLQPHVTLRLRPEHPVSGSPPVQHTAGKPRTPVYRKARFIAAPAFYIPHLHILRSKSSPFIYTYPSPIFTPIFHSSILHVPHGSHNNLPAFFPF